MASVTPQEIVSLLVVLLPIFFGNNPTEQEIIAFLTAIMPILGGATTGTVPAFRVGGTMVGPIPFAPVP
jgi:hypothetical protein